MRCGTHDVRLYGIDGGQADKYVSLDEAEKKSVSFELLGPLVGMTLGGWSWLQHMGALERTPS